MTTLLNIWLMGIPAWMAISLFMYVYRVWQGRLQVKPVYGLAVILGGILWPIDMVVSAVAIAWAILVVAKR